MARANEKILDDYNKVVSCAEILSVQLVETRFKIEQEILLPDQERTSSYDIEVVDMTYEMEDLMAIAYLSCTVETKEKDKPVLVFQAIYVLPYHIGEECDEESVFAFLRRVAPFACYPYFRALFASMCGAANVPMQPLPILK